LLVLHEVLRDGTVRHGPMGRAEWDASLRSSGVSSRWAHRQDDCHNPVERLFEQINSGQPTTIGEIGPELSRMGFPNERSAYLDSIAHVPVFGDPSTKPAEKKPSQKPAAPPQLSLF
jgi:hypothetical protein